VDNIPATNLFCTNCGNPVSAQAATCLSCGARPAGHRKFCRHCGVALNPEHVICIKCGAGIPGTSNSFGAASPLSYADRVKMLHNYFGTLWVCSLLGYLVAIADEFMQVNGSPTILTLIAIPLWIVGIVYWCMLLYQLWKLIPAHIARTTPGKAVGFQFIPIFCYYWCFVAYWGLSKDMNETLRQRKTQYRVSEGLGLTCALVCVVCVTTVLFPVVVVDLLAGFVSLVVCILFAKSVKDGGIALLEQGEV